MEVSKINTNESNIFPYNEFEVKIWSNDHEPPHFHVICDGWNVSYAMEDGRRLEVLSKGCERNVFDYMEANVLKWLSSKCFIQPILTNKENTILQWVQLHDD